MEHRKIHPPGVALLIFAVVLTTVCFGFLAFYWREEWPPSLGGLISAAVGVWMASIYCLDRALHWDVGAWKWADRPTYNAAPRWLYLVGPLGMAGAGIVQRIWGFSDTAVIAIPLSCAFLGSLGLWTWTEIVRYSLQKG